MKTQDENVVIIGDLDDTAKNTPVTIDEEQEHAALPKGAVLNDDKTVTLKLQEPVELHWRKPGASEATVDRFEDLTFRRLKGADMIAVQEAAPGMKAMIMFARSSGISVGKFKPIFERMDAADIASASEVIAYFLSNGRTTGP
jgi:hypothetical protein